MHDETELPRIELKAALVAGPGERAELEAKYGKVWSTDELSAEFSVEGFMAPFVVARRKADGARGSLMFRSHPRFYFGFEPA